MNKVLRWILAGVALAGVAALLTRALGTRRAEPHQAPKPERPTRKPARVTRLPAGESTIQLDRETQARIGLKTQQLLAASLRPEALAYGRLEEDPSRTFILRAPVAGTLQPARPCDWPGIGQTLSDGATVGWIQPRIAPVDRVNLTDRLANARADVEAIRASLTAARAAFERTRALNADNKNASDRAVQEAEVRMKGEEARLAAATQSVHLLESSLQAASAPAAALQVERGGQVVEVLAQPGESVESGQPILRLTRFDRLLARVDLPAGETLGGFVSQARLVALGHEDHPIRAQRIALAASVDPKTQAQGYLFRVPDPGFTLRPGLAVTAYLELSRAPRRGVTVPRSALVRHAGKVWAYLAAGADQFIRKEVVLAEGTAGGDFTQSLSPGDRVVVVGAQTLLSEEFKSQIQVENPE